MTRTTSFLLVDGSDIARWADRRDAQARLPQLIRRLVLATIPHGIESISFRAEEGVALAGWDGLVQTTVGNAHVPGGTSVWEMGVDSAVKGKAEDDYQKRSTDPAGVDPSSTTFMFVTPRRWKNKQKWSESKRREGVWKDVRAYDADDLATWLETAPGVHLWISALAAKHPGSAEDLSTFWEGWASVTNPPIIAELVTAGRSAAVELTRTWLSSQASATAIRGENAEEAIAFFAAALRSLPPEERDRALARAIVVTDIGAWQVLTSSERPLILLPVFSDRTRTPAAVGLGHHVLLPQGRNEPSVGNTIELPRVTKSDARAAFGAMGVEEKRIEELASLARVSINAVRRRIAVLPSSLIPVWAEPSAARSLAPAVLLGSWTEESAADQTIVGNLAQVIYADYRKQLEQVARVADPPLRKIGSVWTVVAKEDSWALIVGTITDDDLKRFSTAAIEVLGALNPKYELPLNQRMYAGMKGKVLPYSQALRESVADTLAMIAVNSGVFPLNTQADGQEVSSRVVEILLRNATSWEHWASISDLLTSLAEGAPNEFLAAIERDLASKPPLLLNIFHDADGLFAGSPHTGLLFALEALAWSPDYLAPTTLVLARLAQLDPYPASNLANRPARTLREIFLLWHPSTMATLEQRLAALDRIITAEPDVAWTLLLGLVPKGMDAASPTARPTRRDWVSDERPEVSRAEFYRGTLAVVERLRKLVGVDGRRWHALIEVIEHVPEREYEPLVAQLSAIDLPLIGHDDRLEIWAALREQLARHREFEDVEWAIPEPRLSKLDALYERFAPTNEVDKYAWLFGAQARLPRVGLSDWQAHHAALLIAQQTAVEEVYEHLGFDGVLTLANAAEHSGDVGNAFGRSKADIDLLTLDKTLGSPDRTLRDFAVGFLYGRRFVQGNDWFNALRQSPSWSHWTAGQRADYFLTLPMADATWRLLEEEGPETQRLHWENRTIVGIGELDKAGTAYVARKFVEHGRIAKAIDFLAAGYHVSRSNLDAEVVAEVLESALAEQVTSSEASVREWASIAHDTSSLLEFVDGVIDDARLARLEWFYLPLVRRYRPAKALARSLASSPEFFVNLLKVIFKARSEKAKEASDEEKQRALAAYELLKEFRTVPGSSKDGTFDGDALTRWVYEVRAKAAEVDRAAIADEAIGQLLAFSPIGTDGIWPHQGVRDLIESLSNDEVERGISIGVYNKRGVVSRGMGDGGKLERDIAKRYRTYARGVRSQWHRTARLLDAIAQGYEHDAVREDQRVEVEEQLWASRRPIRRAPRLVNPDDAAGLKIEASDDEGSVEDEADE